MKDNGFKIIALRPLKGCGENYLKILKENEWYYFYNNYAIDEQDSITFTEVVPQDFYRVNNIDVNICAIVGKNGSGKSTIIELLFRAINNFAKKQDGITAELNYVPGLRLDLYFHTDSYYKMQILDSEIHVYGYDGDGHKLPNQIKEYSLRNIFYTIAVNYSHYAYNTNDLDDEVNWLYGLFHKNDGYQTPLVLNPLRNQGEIDINNENHLVKSRLIGNLLRLVKDPRSNFRKLTDRLEAVALKLRVNKSKRNTVLYEIITDVKKSKEKIALRNLKIDRNRILELVNYEFEFGYKKTNFLEHEVALDYVLYKLVSIALKYDDYTEYFVKENLDFIPSTLEEYIKKVIADDSHITFKLKQTLNYLKYQDIDFRDQTIDLADLSPIIDSHLKNSNRKRTEIIEFIPPPIFSIEILLKTTDNVKTDIPFKRLSSGEKQMIYSISSLLYHLINLNSIRPTQSRIPYKYVNIVLEEIELYFHPEMQRTYIHQILESIKRLELRRIRGINLCFVTHSPFILSDIPESNILFLSEQGTPESTENIRTFGGNIHDLLAKSFFLGNGYMGEFAQTRIQNIIDFLQPPEKALSNTRDFTRESVLAEINVVGEPFLKQKLMEMYYKKFETQKRIAELRAQIERLENNG